MDKVGRDGMGERLPYKLGLSRDFYKVLAVMVAGAAAVFGVVLYLRLTAPPDEQTYIPKPVQITPEIALLQRYVRIDTSNPPGNELSAARLLVDEMKRNGIAAELIESAPGRANVYARLRGEQPNEGLLLFHHIDVVPASSAGWQRPPFGAEIYLNQIWGRGTLDMKGIGVCHLTAFTHLARSGIRPKRDLVFLAVADEEVAGGLGTAWLLRNRPDVFQGVKYAINEGGFTEMRGEKLTYFGIEVGTKQFVEVRLRSKSRRTLQEARIALEPYIAPLDPDRILPEVRSFFRAVAPYRIYGRSILHNIDAAVEAGDFWMLQDTFRSLTQNQIFPFGIEEDSEGFTMRVLLSNLPDEDPDRMVERLDRLVRPFQLILEVQQKMGPTRISQTNTPFFDLMTAMVRKRYGADAPVGPQILANYTNDSRYLRAAGIEAYGLWPFLVDFYQTQGIHSVDERVRADWFATGVALTRDLVMTYCTT